MPLGKTGRAVNAGKPLASHLRAAAGNRAAPCYGAGMITRPAAPFLPVVLALLAVPLLAGCANGDSSRYPSLSIRDVERIKGSAEPVAPETALPGTAAPSADLAGRLAQLQQQAAAANQAFMGAVPSTESLIDAAAGSAVASENWSVATAALTRLDSLRNQASLALADLDKLYVDSEMEVGAVDAISAARGAVQAQVAGEEAVLDRLSARMPN